MAMVPKQYFTCFAFLCLLSIGTLVLQKQLAAETVDKNFNAEDIAIAFYKTGGIVPNFKTWITEREPYNITPAARRRNVMKEELLRLQTAYKNYDPETDFLIIKTSAYLIPEKTQIGEDEFEYRIKVAFDKGENTPYLPYEFLEQNIMVIPDHFETSRYDIATKGEYDRLKTFENKLLPIILRLKPNEADFTHPYKVDGIEQWAFATDIISMESWDGDGLLFWEYTKPGYVSLNQQKIKKLFDMRPENAESKGTEKPVPALE